MVRMAEVLRMMMVVEGVMMVRILVMMVGKTERMAVGW